MCTEWASGRLLDGNGAKGPPRSGKGIAHLAFANFEGDITRDEKMSIFEACLNGRALLKKESSYKGELKTIGDLAKDIKVITKLKSVIIQYYVEHYESKFAPNPCWEDIWSVLPDLKDPEEVSKLRGAAGEKWLSGLLARNARADRFPSGLTMRLENIANYQFGGATRERIEPFRVFVSDDHMQTVDPPKLDERNPSCPLAIVDFTREFPSNEEKWTELEVVGLLRYIVHLPRNPVFVVVISCYPGELASNITLALKRLTVECGVDYHCEYGTFTRTLGPNDGSRFMHRGPELIYYIGVTREPDNVEWKDVFKVNEHGKCPLLSNFEHRGIFDLDFDPDLPSRKDEETTVEEDLAKFHERLATRAPAWDMVDMRPQRPHGLHRGFVNEWAKPSDMLIQIIRLFSMHGDTVLDFFSGGQVLRCSILCGRECFVYSDSSHERDFTLEYGRALHRAFWNREGPTWYDKRTDITRFARFDPTYYGHGSFQRERQQVDPEPPMERNVPVVDLSERLKSRCGGKTNMLEKAPGLWLLMSRTI